MTERRLKAYSTRVPKQPPIEFEDIFIERGWSVVNRMYGKRCAQRWFIALGPQRLRALRDAHLLAARQTAVTKPRTPLQKFRMANVKAGGVA